MYRPRRILAVLVSQGCSQLFRFEQASIAAGVDSEDIIIRWAIAKLSLLLQTQVLGAVLVPGAGPHCLFAQGWVRWSRDHLCLSPGGPGVVVPAGEWAEAGDSVSLILLYMPSRKHTDIDQR